jgi:hypothetical protein
MLFFCSIDVVRLCLDYFETIELSHFSAKGACHTPNFDHFSLCFFLSFYSYFKIPHFWFRMDNFKCFIILFLFSLLISIFLIFLFLLDFISFYFSLLSFNFRIYLFLYLNIKFCFLSFSLGPSLLSSYPLPCDPL